MIADKSTVEVGRKTAADDPKAKSGAGLSPLPTIIGESEHELTRMLDPIPNVVSSFHLVMHEDMKRTPRVRVLFDFFVCEMKSIRPMLGEVKQWTDRRMNLGSCPSWVNRYQNAMSALRPLAPQSRTLSCGAANDAKGHVDVFGPVRLQQV
jgi:hypothetical protein